MLFGITATIVVLVTSVLSQNNNNDADFNCDALDHIFTALSKCQLNSHFNGTAFMADNTFHGYKILNTMATVCSNYQSLRNCVAAITTICPSLDSLLTNTAQRYHNRLCTGTALSDWFPNAMNNDTKLNASCVTRTVSDTLRQCRARGGALDSYADGNSGTMLSSTERRATILFNCLRTMLPKAIEKDGDAMCRKMRAQDVMLVFYTYITVGHELILPSDEEFEAFKKFVLTKSRRDWLPIFAGRR